MEECRKKSPEVAAKPTLSVTANKGDSHGYSLYQIRPYFVNAFF